jgi:hypothetical protein
MHPEFQRALVKARHEDLLNEHRPRRPPRARLDKHSPSISLSRKRVGSMLIWVGALLRPSPRFRSFGPAAPRRRGANAVSQTGFRRRSKRQP